MKHQKYKKQAKLLTIFGLSIIIVLLGYFLWHFKQSNRQFDINSLDLSDWTPNSYPDSGFIFPKNNIFVYKSFENSYQPQKDVSIGNYLNIQQNDIDSTINNSEVIKKISTQLEKSGFKKENDLSGTYSPYDQGSWYLSTYHKRDVFCQIKIDFDCYKSNCATANDIVHFGCGKFDLEKEFQTQNEYISSLKTYQHYSDKPYTSYIYKIQTNDKYMFILENLITDIGGYFINKDNQEVCGGKGCCHPSYKEDPTLWGDWCTDDYQTLETYQPVGL